MREERMAIAAVSSRRPLPSKRLLIAILSIAVCIHTVSAAIDIDEGYSQVLSNQFMNLNPRMGSRFLAATNAVKGDRCDPSVASPCSEGLQCCQRKCTDLQTSRNNCGACSNRCGFGQLCCNGKCTTVAYDVNNCGKCGVVCNPGVRCEYGACGYA